MPLMVKGLLGVTDSCKDEMKCTKLHRKPSTDIWGSVKCTKLVMVEMYEIGRGKPSYWSWQAKRLHK